MRKQFPRLYTGVEPARRSPGVSEPEQRPLSENTAAAVQKAAGGHGNAEFMLREFAGIIPPFYMSEEKS